MPVVRIYVFDGGRYHEVFIGRTVYYLFSPDELTPLLNFYRALYRTVFVCFCNDAPPGAYGDYSRGCYRHQRPVLASVDRPCCSEAADDIYTWWEEIRNCQNILQRLLTHQEM